MVVEDANGWELRKDDLCLAGVGREDECAGARLTEGKLALMRCCVKTGCLLSLSKSYGFFGT